MTNSLHADEYLKALAALLAATLVMRGPVTMMGPLAPDWCEALSLTHADFGFLSALPIAMFGVGSFLAVPIAGKFGLKEAVALALVLVAAGAAARAVPVWEPLLAATVFCALGIAFLNVLMPVVVKTAFAGNMGRVMGLYTGVVGLSGALGGLTAVPLAHGAGLAAPTLFWGVLGLLALTLWWAAMPGGGSGKKAVVAVPDKRLPGRLLKSPAALAVIAVMGIQSLLIYTVAAWLPAWLQETGSSPEAGGTWLFVYLASGLPASMLTPRFANWCRSDAKLVLILAAAYLFGVAGWFWGGVWLLPGAVAAGASQGAMLSVAFLLMAKKCADAAEMLAMSALAQGIGYLAAGSGPWLFGVLLETLEGLDGWGSAWAFTAVMIVLWGAAGVAASGYERVLPQGDDVR